MVNCDTTCTWIKDLATDEYTAQFSILLYIERAPDTYILPREHPIYAEFCGEPCGEPCLLTDDTK